MAVDYRQAYALLSTSTFVGFSARGRQAGINICSLISQIALVARACFAKQEILSK